MSLILFYKWLSRFVSTIYCTSHLFPNVFCLLCQKLSGHSFVGLFLASLFFSTGPCLFVCHFNQFIKGRLERVSLDPGSVACVFDDKSRRLLLDRQHGNLDKSYSVKAWALNGKWELKRAYCRWANVVFLFCFVFIKGLFCVRPCHAYKSLSFSPGNKMKWEH